ncbi:MAG: nuclear transport factor 2 family protein [Chitinophagaceae bacterium]
MSTLALTDNAKTVGKLYEAFGRGDIAYIIDHLSDDCTWIGAGKDFLPQGGTYKGKEAINFFIKLGEAEEFTAFNPEAIHTIGEHEVVAFGFMAANAKKTGKKVASEWVMRWKFDDDGKVIYFQDFFNTAAAYVADQL